jgi:hypothetical protein
MGKMMMMRMTVMVMMVMIMVMKVIRRRFRVLVVLHQPEDQIFHVLSDVVAQVRVARDVWNQRVVRSGGAGRLLKQATQRMIMMRSLMVLLLMMMMMTGDSHWVGSTCRVSYVRTRAGVSFGSCV